MVLGLEMPYYTCLLHLSHLLYAKDDTKSKRISKRYQRWYRHDFCPSGTCSEKVSYSDQWCVFPFSLPIEAGLAGWVFEGKEEKMRMTFQDVDAISSQRARPFWWTARHQHRTHKSQGVTQGPVCQVIEMINQMQEAFSCRTNRF